MIGPVTAHFRLGCFVVELALGLLRVFRNVDQHRTGPSGPRDEEGFAHRMRHFVRVRDEIIMLRDRQRHARDVRLLKGIGTDELAAHLAGDADDRRRIHHGSCDAGHHVRGAGARGCYCNTYFARRARVTVCHMRRALLVAYEDVMKLAVFQRVIGRQNRSAGITENVRYAFALDAFPKDSRARQRLLSRSHLAALARTAHPVLLSPQPLLIVRPVSARDSSQIKKPTKPRGRWVRRSFQIFVLSSITPSGPADAYYRYYYAKSHKLRCAEALPEDEEGFHC